MLKENKIGQTVSMKMSNGDEVVGKISGQTADEINVSKPVILAATRDGLTMVPFMMTAEPEGDFIFKVSNIICIANTNDQVSDAYLESTTGIKPIRNSSSIIV